MLRAETGAACGLLHCGGDRLFDRRSRREILDAPAVRAHEMVMVLGEVLVELVAGEVVGSDDTVHDAGLFEHDEVAVHRALREPAPGGQDLGNRQWARRAGEHVDDALTGGRETLRVRVQPARDCVARAAHVARTPGHAAQSTGYVSGRWTARTERCVASRKRLPGPQTTCDSTWLRSASRPTRMSVSMSTPGVFGSTISRPAARNRRSTACASICSSASTSAGTPMTTPIPRIRSLTRS